MRIDLQELDGFVEFCMMGKGDYLISKSISKQGKEVLNKDVNTTISPRPNKSCACKCKWKSAAVTNF